MTERDDATKLIQSQIHNKLVPELIKLIVIPVAENGGDSADMLVIVESLTIGILLTCCKEGGEEIVFERVVDAVRRRLKEITDKRLAAMEPEGRA